MDQSFADLIMQNMADVKSEIKDLRGDVTKILAFKWQIIGGSLVLSVILTLAIQIFAIFYNKGV